MNWRDELIKVGVQSGVLGRFAGPYAFRQAVVLPVLFFLLFNAFVADLLDTDDAMVSPLAGVALATLVAWTFFTATGLLLDRTLRSPSTARSVAVGVVYALTELVRIQVIYALAGEQEFGSDLGALYRLSAAATTGLVFLGLASVAVGDYLDYRDSYRSYSDRVTRLTVALQETQSHVELVRAQFATWVRRLLTYNVSSAFKMGSPQDPRHLEIANELFRISDELVRPLSHGLSESAPNLPDFRSQRETPKVPFRTFVRDALLVAPFQPVTAMVIVGVVTLPNVLIGNPLLSLGFWALLVSMIFVVGVIGRVALAPQLHKLPGWFGILAVTTLFAFPFPVYGWLWAGNSFSGAPGVIAFLAYVTVIGVILVWLPAMAEGLRFSRGRFVTDLKQLDQQLQWSQTRAQAQLWLDQRRLALALHSDVQSTILASAMQLKNAVEAGPAQSKKVLPGIERTIRKSLLLSFDDPKVPALRSVVTKINKTWASLTALTLEAPKDVIAAIGNDPLALEVVAEAIKELHMNSFKHGRATECVITLSLASAGAVRVVMRNNGAPLAEGALAGKGLGNSFFGAACLSNTAQNVPGGVEVVLEIPVLQLDLAKTG